jgi:hypothetical protein
MRIVWGLHDTNFESLVCLFEAENLLVNYRDYCLKMWYDDQTKPLPSDELPGDDLGQREDYAANRERLLNLGYDRWRADQINDPYPRYVTKKYELWNSVPPNVERLVVHFDT